MPETTPRRVPTVGMDEPGLHAGAAWLAPTYFAAYLGYLFLRPESEALHWISLVAIPVTLSVATARPGSGSRVARGLASVGLRWGRLRKGLTWAVPLGLILGALQLILSRNGDAIRGRLADGSIAWLLPLVFLLMLLTAGFTEELFFRGFLQTRLEDLAGSRTWGLVLASLCFGVYHLPYAYLNPNWPSAGDWGAAWGAALGQGVPGGLILGAVYLASGRNLLAPAVVHALINTLPALTMVHVGGQ
jgi:membrane protease YdiL (CAAX protease family)